MGQQEPSFFNQKVHVAFLGWEIERIVAPVIQMHCDRLIMICFPQEREHAWKYLVEIKKQLESKMIVVEVIETSLYELVDLISILNKIFQVERMKGNQLFINVSAGTKITACASTIAAMTRDDVTPYYVQMETYLPIEDHIAPPVTLTSGLKAIMPLPECQIALPEQRYIKVLKIIHEETKRRLSTGPGHIYIKDLISSLKKAGVVSVKKNKDRRKQASSEYMSVRSLLSPLEEWGFIKISPKARNKFVDITKKGKDAIQMYLEYDLEEGDIEKHVNDNIVTWIEFLERKDV